MVAFSYEQSPGRRKKAEAFSMPLRIVLWQEDGRWWAQCLEIDALGDGKTTKAAVRMLAKAIAATVDFCLRNGREDSIIQPADAEAWNKFARGEHVVQADMEITLDYVDPRPLDIRRYVPPHSPTKAAYA